MYFSFSTLGIFCVAAVIVWFWQDGLRARDVANAAAMAACKRIGLQFLDGTAAFANLRFIRDNGRLRLRRTYVFDYTSQSIERRQGFAILLGMEVEYVGFAPEHTVQAAVVDESSAPSLPDDNASPTPPQNADNIVDFDTHRARAIRKRMH